MPQHEVSSDLVNQFDAIIDRIESKIDTKLDRAIRLIIATCVLAWINAILIFALLITRW